MHRTSVVNSETRWLISQLQFSCDKTAGILLFSATYDSFIDGIAITLKHICVLCKYV